MAAAPCRKCGRLRKIDIISASDGWHQPPCYICGDSGYIQPFDTVTKKEEDFFKRFDEVEWNWEPIFVGLEEEESWRKANLNYPIKINLDKEE